MRDLFVRDPATAQLYTLSLHDALPIFPAAAWPHDRDELAARDRERCLFHGDNRSIGTTGKSLGDLFDFEQATKRFRSEEHTSELQSRRDLVCRLLLEKKKKRETLHTLD